MADQHRPPRPPSQSEPTLRTAPLDAAQRAAGLVRPPFKSDPTLANPETIRHEVKRHGSVLAQHNTRIETLEGATGGSALHADNVSDHLAAQDEATAILFEHLGIEEKLPAALRRSAPPPALDGRPPKKKKRAELATIKDDSWKAKIAGYATAAAIIVKVFYDVLQSAGVVK